MEHVKHQLVERKTEIVGRTSFAIHTHPHNKLLLLPNV